MATESTIGHLSAHDERELKDFLPPVCDLKDRIRKRKSIHVPSYKVEGFCKCFDEAVWNGLEGGEKIALLLVKATNIVDFARDFHASRLKDRDYENIRKFVVVSRSDWQRLLMTSDYYSRDPKTLEKRLPDDYFDLLRSRENENRKICPWFYCLTGECSGSIVVARWSKQLWEELGRHKVHGCACRTQTSRDCDK